MTVWRLDIDKTPVSLLLHPSSRRPVGQRTSPMRFVAMKKSTKTTGTPKGVTKG
jgi:hypothetical protein